MDKKINRNRLWLPGGISAAAFLAVNFSCFAADALRQGNIFYNQGNLDEAIKKYDEAEKNKGSNIINFNRGAAFYKKNDFKNASDDFSKALATENKKIEANSYYNLANSKYKMGQALEAANPESSIGLYKESLENYRKAIELSGDDDARFNYEFVSKKLKEAQKKLDQQKNGAQSKSQQGQGSHDKKDSRPSGEKQGKEEQKEGQTAQEKSLEPQEEQAQSGKENRQQDESVYAEKVANKTEEESSGAYNQTGMSKKEADMILDSYRDEESFWKAGNQVQKRNSDDNVAKDW